MPAPMILHDVSHVQQRHDGDCLAACAAMILDVLDQHLEYAELLWMLQIRAYGAPASNMRLLSTLGFDVTYSATDLAGLEALLHKGHCVILFVRTGELPYWTPIALTMRCFASAMTSRVFTSTIHISKQGRHKCLAAIWNLPGLSMTIDTP